MTTSASGCSPSAVQTPPTGRCGAKTQTRRIARMAPHGPNTSALICSPLPRRASQSWRQRRNADDSANECCKFTYLRANSSRRRIVKTGGIIMDQQPNFAPPWWADFSIVALALAGVLALSYCSSSYWWESPVPPWTMNDAAVIKAHTHPLGTAPLNGGDYGHARAGGGRERASDPEGARLARRTCKTCMV